MARTRTARATPTQAVVTLADRCHRATDALVATCQAGNTSADLHRAWESTGERRPEIALDYGMGIGPETPMIGFGRSAGVTLHEAGGALRPGVGEPGGGGRGLEREMVRFGPNGPEILTRRGR